MVRLSRLALSLIACCALHFSSASATPTLKKTAAPDLWQPITVPRIQRYDSWQIRYPFQTAVLSTFTLGLWPAPYGSDTHEVPDYMEKSWTQQGLAFVRTPAERAFFSTRKIIYLIEILILWLAIKPNRVFKFMSRRSRE